MQFSKKAQKCGVSPMRKFHPYQMAAADRGVTVYHLNIGQPDIVTPKAYFDAIRNFSQPVLEYAPSQGVPALIQAVQRYYAKIGMDYSEADIYITSGGSEALSILMLCILDEGSEVIVPEPFYPNYSTFIQGAGGVIRPLSTSPEDGYDYVKPEAMEALINDKTRAILLTNPGNPTGTVHTKEQLRPIMELAKKHDLFVIGDEGYREFAYGSEQPASVGEFPELAQNAVIIDSASKRFSACGARIGALITKNQELQRLVMKFCQGRLSVATLDQLAAAALFEVEPSYFTAVREEYKLRRNTVYEALKKMPGVVCQEPKGAFYMMAKLPIDDTDAFQRWLLTDFSNRGETVMFAPGESFYATPGAGRDEIRIAYVLKREDLSRAMELLALGVAAYQSRQRNEKTKRMAAAY